MFKSIKRKRVITVDAPVPTKLLWSRIWSCLILGGAIAPYPQQIFLSNLSSAPIFILVFISFSLTCRFWFLSCFAPRSNLPADLQAEIHLKNPKCIWFHFMEDLFQPNNGSIRNLPVSGQTLLHWAAELVEGVKSDSVGVQRRAS